MVELGFPDLQQKRRVVWSRAVELDLFEEMQIAGKVGNYLSDAAGNHGVLLSSSIFFVPHSQADVPWRHTGP
jgi:hypothetical protein